MDSKGLAKSKRAHSQQHNRKNHPNRNPNRPNKPSQPPLPSNQDRYLEEEQQEQQQSSSSSTPLPKSQGADYRHLVAEAQSQPQSKSTVEDVLSDEFSSLVVGSMLSVKGDGILAWLGSDNFVVDDGNHLPASNPEVTFLSLNLNVLAQQLEKIDFRERLFIEEDLLPPDMRTKVRESDDTPPSDSVTVLTQRSEELSQHTPPLATSAPEAKGFQASIAEAELDMLLDSLNEVGILDSPHTLASDPSVSLDDDLDELLKETASNFHRQNSPKPFPVQPSSSSNSKELTDFDSWLDTM